ncbi:uncharacterized protein GGS22DRAFT_185161 [Annulohypoxylon maeteangense]|uniref:uncharacterized protein n=1 Tax=Annulohypoxylon maeteangense TaxID=1927788 RepID=UPI002008A6B7|nr:uncharacterized protein GGS22DRAFT_185161 [Annulohypoxylon maeteangense]KAI0887782.1 hypothetical protein GGS22DRAFT_185161 [Annulohypoxylon maeteangense]
MPMPNINHIIPGPFQCGNYDPRNLPDLDDDSLDDLTAVLRALAKGSYPRLDSVPLALNAYNCNRKVDIDPWAYFHPVTVITPADVKMKGSPSIELDKDVIDDMAKPWNPIRHTGGQFNAAKRQFERGDWTPPPGSARYRFLCFIHKHRINRKSTIQKGVHTVSIWDREWDELTWHDTYHVDRETRRREIERFWQCVRMPNLIDRGYTREQFMNRIRYRIVYDICERVENTLRDTVPPRNTLYAVIGAALQHMNNACDAQVSIVPDRLELFGAQGLSLVPRFFAHLLWLCLDARPDWTREQRVKFVKQFKILERLRWMRAFVRRDLERRIAEVEMEVEDGDGGDEREGREWVFGLLGI